MSAPLVAVESVILFLLLASSAFFSSSETCLFSLDPIDIDRLKERHPHAADRIEKLLAAPTALLSSILIGNTLVNVAAASLGFSLALELGFEQAEVIAIPVMTVLLLVLGEITPKQYAMRHAPLFAMTYAAPLTILVKLLTPIQRILERATHIITKSPTGKREAITEDEFLTVVEVSEEEGILDEEEREMVDGIIRLEESQASDIMTPRVDLIGIDLSDPRDEQEAIARSVRFRYLPVFRESMDDIEGFLDVPRFLLTESCTLEEATVPPFVIPENAPLDSLLTTFLRENRRVAVVADEFGGTAGLITRGDILEEIAEDVDNEFGEKHFTIQQIGDNRWLIDGSLSLEDINYELETELEAEGADRISGWVTALAERIPRTGESVEGQGCRVTVQRLRRHRITLVLLERLEIPDDEEEDVT